MNAMKLRTFVPLFVLVLAGGVLSCSEVNRKTAPVELLATVSQNVQTVDLTDDQCGSLGTVTLRSIVKRTDVSDTRFLDVQLKSMKVSYQRTDGGTLIPASFVQTVSGIISAGSSGTDLNDFLVFQSSAFTQAPFAALYPNNGGIDPETGHSDVKMDVLMEIYGETLAGDDVAATARFPLTFCYSCGGCQ